MTPMTPEVSIILVNYNSFELTCQCIKSIYRFTTGITFEVIVVDNASRETDANSLRETFSEIIVIKSDNNVGFAGGNNLGLAHARGSVILLLNNDTILTDNAIAGVHKKLLDSDCSVATCKLVFPDGTIQPNCGRFPSISLTLLELFRLQKLLSPGVRGRMLLGSFFDYKSEVNPDWIWGTFFMFKRKVLDVFPGHRFTETYFLYVEDLEWCYHIHRAGHRIMYVPDHAVVHLAGSTTSLFFQTDLNPTIRRNFVDFVTRQYGKTYAALLFSLQRLNSRLTGSVKKIARGK
jgi:GT2 family glycosyltransferase